MRGPPNHCVLLPQLVLGNAKGARDGDLLAELHVEAVVNLIHFDAGEPKPHAPHGIRHFLHHPVVDLPRTTLHWAEEAARFVDEQWAAGRVVLVHCSQGVSRAPSLCLYLLLTRKHMSLTAAWAHVRERRPVVCPSAGFWAGLHALDPASPLTLAEYSARCCHELFPSLSRAQVDEAYAEAMLRPVEAGERNIEPVGYTCVELLMAQHPAAFVKRFGASAHHPFD